MGESETRSRNPSQLARIRVSSLTALSVGMTRKGDSEGGGLGGDQRGRGRGGRLRRSPVGTCMSLTVVAWGFYVTAGIASSWHVTETILEDDATGFASHHPGRCEVAAAVPPPQSDSATLNPDGQAGPPPPPGFKCGTARR
jgi:hypothetical protein